MTYDDVIYKILYQIRTPGAVISLHAKFGPNRSNFGKTDSRNPPTQKFQNFNLFQIQ
jgi:hypothetical protein